MTLIDFTCPKCGAALKIENGASQVSCEYCGSSFIVDGASAAAPAPTPSPAAAPQPTGKKNTVWWVLGWIFIFPVPLTILILRNKTLKPVLKVLIIALAWIVYIAIAESADEEEKNTDGDEKASVEMKELSEACAEESILDTEFCL